MFFLFWVGTDVREARRPGGFFRCPRCAETRPCDRVRVTRTLKAYSVLPIWKRTLSDERVCQACGARESESVPVMAPLAPGPVTWECAACGNRNPLSPDPCLRCGARRP
jgi:hypothetical protein